MTRVIEEQVPGFSQMDVQDQERLCRLADSLRERGMPEVFITSSLRSTADVLREFRDEQPDESVMRREEVQRFIEQNAVPSGRQSAPIHPARERRREDRERLTAHVVRLLREARLARARHEVKKTRSMLLKLDQRELRRVLGSEGENLCRQINTWLRSTAPMF